MPSRKIQLKSSAKGVAKKHISCVVPCLGSGIEVGGPSARCVELKIAYADTCSLCVELDFGLVPTRSVGQSCEQDLRFGRLRCNFQ
jgi:hypothetical protein